MLSFETPCKASVLRADERASDQLALKEGDPAGLGESQAPNFSIRDYVFTSRSKDIATNWPFPRQFLQLCLNHGVQDVLPPFEPPDSVRTRCCINAVESEQPVACPGDEKVSSQFESVEIEDVGLVEEEPRKGPVDQGDTLVDESIKGNHDQTERISDQISERHPSEKKCRLIVKYGAITESSRVEDIVSTSSTVSDPMASKVCPVCKTFASTSNTTLNAHIDQCLSTESNTKWLVSEIPKPKGKPRKKRLMVDIYTTAAHCTLEDLDRRNGTNWVTELAFVAPTNEASTEIKRPKLSPVVTRDDGHEEAVYFDSNGIKLRILSKFNDTPPSSLTRENFKMKKHADDIKEGENLVVSSKKCFASKYSKCMKVKQQTKKLSSFSLFNGKIGAAPGNNHHADTPQVEEGSPLEMLNDLEQIKIGTSATLRNWVGSKRSDLPKKLNHKDIHNLGHPVLKTTDVGNSSAVKSHFRKLSRPSEDMASFPKAKSAGFLSSTTQTMDNVNEKSPKPSVVNSKWSSDGISTNHLVLKIPRLPMKPSKSCHPSLKIKKSSTMKNSTVTRKPCFSLERSKWDANEKPSTSKMFRKQRSGSTKQGELPPDVDGGLRRSVEHCGINTARTSKKVRTHRSSDLSENFKKSRLEDANTIEKSKYTSLKRRHPRIESHDPEIATCDMQVEALTCEDIRTSSELVNRDTAVSENLATCDIAKLDQRPSVEKNVDSVCGTEAHTEPMAEKLHGEQEIQYCHVTPDEVVSQRIQATDEVEFRGEAETCTAQYTKCQAETASLQESSACLTSHGDASDQDQNPAIDREQQGSPVSTASTISPRSPKDPEFKDSDAEAMMKHTVDNTEGRNKGRKNEKGKVFPPAKEPERYSDDQPCCCSRREGLPRESQFFQQNVMAGMMLPSKGMQISNLKLVPSISSSFSSYPSSRTDLISPTGSITTKASTESAVTVPACIDFSSPSPSPRNQAHSPSSSILRLMGKNLMVTNTEEFQLPTAHHPASEIPSSTQCSPRPSSASAGWESFSYHQQQQQLPGGSVFFGRTPPMVNRHMALHSTDMRVGGSVSPMQASFKMKPDQKIHQQVSKKPNSHQHHQKPVSSYQADMAREVIVIDDSPEFEAEHKYTPVSNPLQQRPFSCFPPQGQFISRGYANTIKRGKASDGSDPLLQRPFVFQSPPTGHLKPPVYYFQTLR